MENHPSLPGSTSFASFNSFSYAGSTHDDSFLTYADIAAGAQVFIDPIAVQQLHQIWQTINPYTNKMILLTTISSPFSQWYLFLLLYICIYYIRIYLISFNHIYSNTFTNQ